MVKLSVLALLGAAAASVSGQPIGMGFGNQMPIQYGMPAYPQAGLNPVGVGSGAFANQPVGFGNTVGFGSGVPLTQPWGAGQTQLGLGQFGTAPIIGAGGISTAAPNLQPWSGFGNIGAGGTVGSLGLGAVGGTVSPVLPQDFGNPSAQFGQLPQPILSTAQATQLVPIQQLQQALDQRVQSFTPLNAPAAPRRL